MKLTLMCLAVAAAFAEGAAAQTLPAGGAVTRGSADISVSGSAMQIDQHTARAVIDWSSFNIGNGASVNFAQPSATSVAVNRVGAGAGASTINGILGANGNVMILNPNGVMFGSTAVVNVAGLIASTGNINDAQFMAGGAFAITGATGGSISNAGSISVSGAGLAAFVAPSVSNSGVIAASTGRINLASAQAATVSFNGGLYELAVDQGVANGAITNRGTLSAGTIVISALDAANVVSGVINLEGIQQANRIEVHGGQVVLKSDLNAATVTGTSREIEVCDCAQIQDAVNIAKVGTPGAGATITVEGGTRTEQVTINKPYLTLTGHNDATVTIGIGQTAFTIAANGVTVEGMSVVGPYSQSYTSVDWSAPANTPNTVGFTIQGNVDGTTIRDNEIRNVRTGVMLLGNTPNTRIAGNLIDNTKGSILVRSSGATISGNRFGALGNEWDIVFLDGVSNGQYFTSPHVNEQQYGAGVMAMSADNGGMKVLDRRYGSNGLLGATPQFGNRSHIVVNAGSSFTAADDFNLGNGLGNARQPLGSIATGIDAVVWGGFVDVNAGTYAQSSTLNVDKSLTLRGAGEAQTIIDARTVSGYGMLVNADNVTLSDFTLYGPTANAGASYGIKVQPAGAAASSRLNNFSISRVTGRGAGRAELDLNGVVGATIDHFTAQGENTAGAGIQITDSANVTISNSTTQGNNWGGVALFQSNRFFDQQNNNIIVQSTNTFHEANPLYLQDESASRDFGALSLQGFDYAVRNSTNTQYTWLQYELGDALAFALGNAAPLASTVQAWNGAAPTQNFYVGSGMSIMQAVDQASTGATVNILPGHYTVIAEDRTLGPGLGGIYDLGLFLYKDGMTLRGVDAGGNPIASASGVQAWITAGASTNFGMNHGVMADNVSVEGLGFKPYAAGPNKTIEIGGDNFTFRNSVVDNRTAAGGAGALYFGELLTGAGGQISSLNVTGSIFYDGSVSLQNGVGVTAGGAFEPASSRTITGNTFVGSSNYRFGGLLFTGKMDEVAWRPMPIGSAVATGNSFAGFDESVMVRGEQQGVDLAAIMAANSFDRAVLVTDAGGNARAGQYLSLGGVTRDKFSIQSSIQGGVDRGQAGDTVSVKAGSYAEDVVVNGARNLIFGGATLQSLTVNAPGSGIGGNANASGGGGFIFNAPIALLGNTSLATTGANITFNGDVQNSGVAPFNLTLAAGSGNILLTSGGTSANPLGYLDAASNHFTLTGTLWVSGYEIDALGTVALSDSTLRSLGTASASIAAGGNVTGSTITQGPVAIDSGGQLVMANVVSQSTIVIQASDTIQIANIETPVSVALTSNGPVTVSGSAPVLSVDAPGGSITGGFGDVVNAGSGIIEVNGRAEIPQSVSGGIDASRVLPRDGASAAADASASEEGSAELYFSTEENERRRVQIVRRSAGEAGAALERGMGVELDLAPGRAR